MKTGSRLSPLATGFVAPNILAILMVFLLRRTEMGSEGVLIYSTFVLVPLVMGMVSSWCWRSLPLSGWKITLYSVINALIAILLSAVFLGEGAICLLIVSPLIISFVLTGAFIGRSVFKRNRQTLNVSIVALLLSLFVADSLSDHHNEAVVADQLVINAPPAEVWKHVVAFNRIKQDGEYWLFRLGMPKPVAATVEGHYIGAKRKCIFSNGYIFDEKIVQYETGKNLTFDIVSQPLDPEIMGHIDIRKGQFLLKDNGDGTTTLTGKSWYRLYVFPAWYYDLWAESITRNVHIRVMEHIKILSEKK